MKTKLRCFITFIIAAFLMGCGSSPAPEVPDNPNPPVPPEEPVTYTLSSDKQSVETGRTVKFTVTSSKDENVTADWSFADETQRFTGNSATWSRPGTYTVTAHNTADPSLVAENTLSITVTGSTYTLSADKVSVTAGEEVSFRVTELMNGVEQEKEPDGFMAGIADGERFISNAVTFLYPGTYEVDAVLYYGTDMEMERARTDNSVTVTVNERQPVGHTNEFYHRVFLAECTSTGCKYCPRMVAAMEYSDKYLLRDRFVTASFHHKDSAPNVTWHQPFTEITADYGIYNMPFYILNWDSSITQVGVESYHEMPLIIRDDVEKALEAVGDIPGIAMETVLSGRELAVKFKTTPAASGEYILSLMLVEDNILTSQSGAEGGKMYQMDVVQESITDGDSSPWPYKMESLGALESGKEHISEYNFTIPKRHVLENCRVIGVINRKDDAVQPHGIVSVNALSCPIGDSIDYQYEPVYE